MIQPGQRARFAIEPLGKTGIAAHRRRQHFQRDETVQRRLPRLVNRPHAALADEAEDFELGKEPGDFLHRRRHEPRTGGFTADAVSAFGGKTGLDEALRAQTQRHVRRQRLAAIGTDFLRFHIIRSFHPLLRKRRQKVALF